MAKTKVFTQTKPAPLTMENQLVIQLDDVTTNGIYKVGYPAVGLPKWLTTGAATYSILLNFVPAPEYTIQVLYRAAGTEMFQRNRVKGVWEEWKKVQMTLL